MISELDDAKSTADTQTLNGEYEVQPPLVPRPTNYYSFERNGIIGNYVIDPTLQIPAAFLPPLADGQLEVDRKNLTLTATQINIDASIWLVGNNPVKSVSKPASLVFNALQGPVMLKVWRLVEFPISLEVTCIQKCVLCLPRSFNGPLTLVGYGNNAISISDAVKLRLVTIGETSSSMDAFVGDLASWEQRRAGGAGVGDRCSVMVRDAYNPYAETKAGSYSAINIEVRYVDEVPAWQPTSMKRRLLGWMFG